MRLRLRIQPDNKQFEKVFPQEILGKRSADCGNECSNKSINDTNGHMTGDSTLKKFASVRTNPFRFQEQIEVAREEFLFLSISVGAYVTDRRHTYEQYYEEADKALYETKKNEKNDYIVCMDVGSSVKIRRGAQAFAG